MSFGGNHESWEWQDEGFRLDADSPLAISRSLWDELTQSEEDSRNLFDTTPIKSCMDSEFAMSSGNGEPISSSLIMQADKDNPHLKRRRMLQFSDCGQQIEPYFTEVEGDFQVSDQVSSGAFWFSTNEETYNNSGSESLDQRSENWMAKCFNNKEQHSDSGDINAAGVFDDEIDLSEFCALQTSELDGGEMWPEPASPAAQRPVITGEATIPQSGMTKLTAPVAYPFALIKPCGVQGDVTLNDINQRIQTLPPTPTHSKNYAKSSSTFTSAFSGKSVVALTKIHTEGNGSITIMRTRG